MTNYLVETLQQSLLNLYFIVFNPQNGQAWNTTLNAGAGGWEAYDSGHWAQYAIAMTEKAGSGYYVGTYPAGIEDLLTTEVIYVRGGGSPALGDTGIGIAQSQGVSLRAIAGDAAAGETMQRSVSTMVRGAVIAGTLAVNQFTTDLDNPEENAYVGRALLFATGDLAGQGATITAYDPDTGLVTVAGAFTAAPAATDVFVIA